MLATFPLIRLPAQVSCRAISDGTAPRMKTTIEIADGLAGKAKAHAAKENVTLRSLIERGLRMALRADSRRHCFKLKDAGVGGRGLDPSYRGADWPRIRETIYKDRGSC